MRETVRTIKRFIDFYEKSVLLNVSVLQTLRSFPHLKDLLIVLIVVKSLDTSMSAHIRISCSEVRQWSVQVTHPHVLQKLVIHPEVHLEHVG